MLHRLRVLEKFRFTLGSVLALFILTISSGKAAARPRSDEAMPTPAGLEQDVRFWERIFSKYKPTQCVFHDKDDLSIVYGVAKLPEDSQNEQTKLVQRYLETVRRGLLRLADGKAPRNRLENHIVAVTPPKRRTHAAYRNAADNVRCQRGVNLLESIERSQAHVRMVKRVLHKYRLPSELAYLPHLESGYRSAVRSRAGALGLWQLMPATARLSGLRVGGRRDARLDPYLSTVAASKHFRELLDHTQGSWPLAVTAYNYGPNGTRRAIRTYGVDYMKIRRLHRTSVFGFAARNYYPSFLAVRNIASRLEQGAQLAAVDSPKEISAK